MHNTAAHHPQAVIFDIDGVLVDSYQPHLESWQALAAETGTTFSEAQFAASFGRTSRDIIREHFAQGPTSDEAISALDDRKEQLYRQLVRERFPVMDGAVELIDALLRDGFRLAVASSGPPENVDLALEQLQRREAFGAAITGRDVTRGKPDPQAFLLAAQQLNVAPSQCVVIEDAPAGIMAAQAGNMAAVALLSRGRHAVDFADLQPDLIVRSLRELSPQRLREVINRRTGRTSSVQS